MLFALSALILRTRMHTPHVFFDQISSDGRPEQGQKSKLNTIPGSGTGAFAEQKLVGFATGRDDQQIPRGGS